MGKWFVDLNFKVLLRIHLGMAIFPCTAAWHWKILIMKVYSLVHELLYWLETTLKHAYVSWFWDHCAILNLLFLLHLHKMSSGFAGSCIFISGCSFVLTRLVKRWSGLWQNLALLNLMQGMSDSRCLQLSPWRSFDFNLNLSMFDLNRIGMWT